MIKHGVDNFSFEHIATCQTWDDANEIETILVTQYDCNIETGNGYNSTRGGFNAPKTEAWKKTISEKAKLRFETNPFYKEQISKRNAGKVHTEEARENMSNAHIGHHLRPNSGQFKPGRIAINKKYDDMIVQMVLNDKMNKLPPKEIQKKYNLSKTIYYKILKNSNK